VPKYSKNGRVSIKEKDRRKMITIILALLPYLKRYSTPVTPSHMDARSSKCCKPSIIFPI
jgi:hypothetical protein